MNIQHKALTSIINPVLKTTALSVVGTATLVVAHHLGRKQYNSDAKLTDYADGVIDKSTKAFAKTSLAHHPLVKKYVKTELPVSPNQDVTKTYQQSTLNTDDSLNKVGRVTWVSGVADLKTNEFAVVGIDDNRQIVWQTRLPERVHDILIRPLTLSEKTKKTINSLATNESNNCRHVAVLGRRPSEHFWVLDAITGSIIHKIKADSNRHFYGHATYSLDGATLYITENNTATFAGVIGVYDVAQDYKKTHEFNSHGIGPHELVMHPDGNTLVVANGGIKTEKASREELNLDSMQPSLVYLNRYNGQLLEQVYPEHNQMSVRHLSIHDNGTVAIGIQFQGERHLNIPLVLTHKRGDSQFEPLHLPKNNQTRNNVNNWLLFHQYIASVKVDPKNNLLCVTSPIGGCAAVFDLISNELVDVANLPDCAGASVWIDSDDLANKIASFLVSDGQGYLTKLSIKTDTTTGMDNKSPQLSLLKVKRPYAFDNHLKHL